jgi:predicted phosphoribosyltransferase
MERFWDRAAAGRDLAGHLAHHRDPVVAAVPPGGVVVGAALARSLGVPLVALPVRRFGAPDGPSLIVGVVTPDGDAFVDGEITGRLGLLIADLSEQAGRAAAVVQTTMETLGVGEPEVAGRDVVLVDEGAASGIHVRAAVGYLRRRGAARVTCALPVAPPSTIDLIAAEADEVVCLVQPLRFGALDGWYERFPPVGEDDVRRLLDGTR